MLLRRGLIKRFHHEIYLSDARRTAPQKLKFLKAILQIDSFQGECKISTWLCQIAKNEYFNYCRKHSRQQSYDAYIENQGEASLKKETWARVTYYRAKQKITEGIRKEKHYEM